MKNLLTRLSVKKFHQLLLSGELSCRELVEYYLRRIEAYDHAGPCLNALILLNPRALEEADAIDAAVRKTGRLTGKLCGVPVILKDNVNTSDLETTAGSESLRGFTPDDDAFITKKLRAAGAIILAKANLHEFAIWGETISSILGQTLNPYDLTRTPGGSSGGTGAAIAADMGMVGIGTDTINSVRSPSSACSLVGIRPTIGMVSRSGIVPYSLTQDTAGPLCRTVADAAAVLEVISGYDKEDEETAWCADKKVDDYSAAVPETTLAGKKIGVLESFFGKKAEHQEVNAVVAKAISVLKALGAQIIPIKEEINSGWLTADVSVHLYDLKDHLNQYLQKLPARAPVHSLEEIIKSGKFHAGIKENLEQAMLHSVGTPDYNERLVLRSQVQTKLMKVFADHDVEAIVYPHQQQLVCEVGGAQKERNGVLCSVTGFPSVVVPAGYSQPSQTAPAGIPIGMEIIGRPWSEKLLLAIAETYEEKAAVKELPPFTPVLE